MARGTAAVWLAVMVGLGADPAQACCRFFSSEVKDVWRLEPGIEIRGIEQDIDGGYGFYWEVLDARGRMVGGAMVGEEDFLDDVGVVDTGARKSLPKHLKKRLARFEADAVRVQEGGRGYDEPEKVTAELSGRLSAMPGVRKLERVRPEEGRACGVLARGGEGSDDKPLRLSVWDRELKTRLPVADFDSHADFRGCYVDSKGPSILVVGWSTRDDGCSGTGGEHLIAFRSKQLDALRENVRGFRAYKKKDYPKALELFDKSLAGDADYHHANFNRACTLALMGRPFEDGKENLDRLLARRDLADRYYRKIQTDGDLDGWRKTPAYRAWFKEAGKRLRPEDHDDALAKLSPREKARALNQRGLNAYRAKRYQEAIDAFRAALRAWPAHRFARSNLASVYALHDQPKKAIAELHWLAERAPRFTARRLKNDRDFASLQDREDWWELIIDLGLENEFDPPAAGP